MLSEDQRHCLTLAARGWATTEIASALDWPIARVRAKLAAAIAALGASSKLEAVIILLRRGEIHL